jgi:hypothetical protein
LETLEVVMVCKASNCESSGFFLIPDHT